MSDAKDSAETLALRALGWLVGNDDLLPVFLSASGADIGTLRRAAADVGFLASVLDFLLQDDAWVMAFCDAAGLDYLAPGRARASLPGHQQVHWT